MAEMADHQQQALRNAVCRVLERHFPAMVPISSDWDANDIMEGIRSIRGYAPAENIIVATLGLMLRVRTRRSLASFIPDLCSLCDGACLFPP